MDKPWHVQWWADEWQSWQSHAMMTDLERAIIIACDARRSWPGSPWRLCNYGTDEVIPLDCIL